MRLADRHGLRKPLLLGALGLWLGWEIVARSLPTYLAASDPEAALWLRPTEVTALVVRADAALTNGLDEERKDDAGRVVEAHDQRVGQWADFARKALSLQAGGGEQTSAPAAALDAQTRAHVRTLPQRALASDPLSARAMRILGQVADDGSVDELMHAAARRSMRESIAVYWLMQERAKSGDYAAAVHYADVLLRTRAGVIPLVVPTLVRAAESEQGDALKAAVIANPPWRRSALIEITKRVQDPRILLDLLLAMRETATPPTTRDLKNYIGFLIERRHYELAYYTWLQFLPPEQLRSAGFLFNGGFENAPGGLPFDWTFRAGPGVTVDVAARLDQENQHALLVEFGAGRAELGGVSQLLMLPGGSYRLTGKYRGTIRGRRGLIWSVRCAGRAPVLGASSMMLGAVPAWQGFEVTFAVPERGCPMQSLQLELDARSASEQLISGSVWYDDLQIARSGQDAAH